MAKLANPQPVNSIRVTLFGGFYIISEDLTKQTMQVNFHQKSIHLSDAQKDYITEKVEMLQKFKVMEDPSVVAKVDVEYFENASSDKKIQMAVTVNIPGTILRAEEAALTVESGIDLIEEKLRHQLERYKTAHE